MSTQKPQRVTADALDWLRETDSLTESAIVNAVEQDLRCAETAPGEISVTNHEYDDPDEHQYTVYVEGSIISSCDCPHFTYRHEICKHQLAAAMWFDARDP